MAWKASWANISNLVSGGDLGSPVDQALEDLQVSPTAGPEQGCCIELVKAKETLILGRRKSLIKVWSCGIAGEEQETLWTWLWDGPVSASGCFSLDGERVLKMVSHSTSSF